MYLCTSTSGYDNTWLGTKDVAISRFVCVVKEQADAHLPIIALLHGPAILSLPGDPLLCCLFCAHSTCITSASKVQKPPMWF